MINLMIWMMILHLIMMILTDANKYKDLLAQMNEADGVGTVGTVGTGAVGAKSATIIDDDGEEVDFDDI